MSNNKEERPVSIIRNNCKIPNSITNQLITAGSLNSITSQPTMDPSPHAAGSSNIDDAKAGNSDPIKKRLESMTNEEIIENNLKELMDKKNREERKANGRLVAVILASLVIFLALYHAWLRKSGLLAGVLIPVVIMVSFGGWVVVLAKRDKAKRLMFEKYLEEIALKNKQDLEAKAKSKHNRKSHDKNESVLHYENEKSKDNLSSSSSGGKSSRKSKNRANNDHRKHRKHRQHMVLNAEGELVTVPFTTTNNLSLSSNNGRSASSHYATKDLRIKRPSIRQRLFRQSGIYQPSASATGMSNATHILAQAVISPVQQCTPQLQLVQFQKRKRLQRCDALQVPALVRMGSAP